MDLEKVGKFIGILLAVGAVIGRLYGVEARVSHTDETLNRLTDTTSYTARQIDDVHQRLARLETLMENQAKTPGIRR